MQFSKSSSRRMFCSNGFDTMHVVCTDLLCVVCIGLSSAEVSTVNTELGWTMFLKARDLNCFLQTNNFLTADFLKQKS